MTPFSHLQSAIELNIFRCWCCWVVIEVLLKLKEAKPLDIGRMDHKFIRLVVFVLPSNIDLRLRVDPFGISRFDFMRWDANEIPRPIAWVWIRRRPWKLEHTWAVIACAISGSCYLDIRLWWSPRILYHLMWLEFAWILTMRPHAQAWKEALEPALHAFRSIRQGGLFEKKATNLLGLYRQMQMLLDY